MADRNYKVLGSIHTTAQRSPTSAEEVEELTVSTRPSGIVFVRNVPYATYEAGKWDTGVALIAEHIEHILSARPHVIGGSPTQSVDQNGIITNNVQFLVSYTNDNGDGPFQDTVTIPVQALHDDETFDKYFDPVVKRLAGLAAG